MDLSDSQSYPSESVNFRITGEDVDLEVKHTGSYLTNLGFCCVIAAEVPS
jgi:hypothetical protein